MGLPRLEQIPADVDGLHLLERRFHQGWPGALRAVGETSSMKTLTGAS